ncbi:NEW3 domain-containing protein [Paenibacillus arenosi]|nr:NEW3 domain-containing protein [Paenibacillus arenosi]
MQKKWMVAFSVMLTLMMGTLVGGGYSAYAASGVALYTPYTNISVTPGESISYSVDVMNNTSSVQNVALSLEGVPKEWKAELTSGGWAIKQIGVKPDSEQNLNLQIDVPLAVEKGTYNVTLKAAGHSTLPLSINVTEQGTYKTELTTEQPNLQGDASSAFDYTLTLKNRTANDQQYALSGATPRGWTVSFLSGGQSVTSVEVAANSTADISVSVKPPAEVKEGSYKIPVKAATNSTSAEAELEAVITGTYGLKLTTPSGLLSTDITAGKEKKLEMQVTNTGTAALKDIELSSTTPVDWEVTFDEDKIASLEPGQSANVTATVKADNKSISGDYQLDLHAKTPESTSDVQFRMTVKTSMLWGWIGVLIIAGVIGGMFYIFRKYGRR